jgi:hypothetical protein
MFTFLEYVEIFEAKVDDLAAKFPDHADAIREYNSSDPTSTKKFLPWLVKQHIAGNVTPDDARIHTTLANFDKFSHKLPNGKDHSIYDYNTVASHVGGNLEASMKKKEGEQAVEKVYHDPKSGVTAQQIKTKEASQKLYGGGATRKGKMGCERGTSWCVAARSTSNMYGSYGPVMYTIHDPNDDAAPYAIHPTDLRGPSVTNRHNNGDMPYEQFLQEKPHLKGPVQSILTHSARQIPRYLESDDVRATQGALSHPMVAREHLARAANHPSYSVRSIVAGHPKATSQQISTSLEDTDSSVRRAAALNPNATDEHREKALSDENVDVAKAAIRNRNASQQLLMKAAEISEKRGDGEFRGSILSHPNITDEIRDRILADKSNVENRRESMRNPKATPKELGDGMRDSAVDVRREAAKHPNLTSELILHGLKDEDKEVRRTIGNHPNNTPETIDKALNDRSQHSEASRAAASHRNASSENLMKALQHPDSYTREFAARHHNATEEHVDRALQDSNEGVREQAIQNPVISNEKIRNALEKDPHHRVRSTAIRQLLARDPDNAAEHVQVAFKDAHPSVQDVIADHKSLTPNQVGELVKTIRPMNSHQLLRNPNLNSSHLLTLIKRADMYGWEKENVAKHKKADSAVINAALDEPGDNGYETRRGAMKNKNATPEHIARGLQDSAKQVRLTAMKNKNASAENITQALQDRLPTVRMQALKHRNVTDEHIRMAANDKDKNVRAAAQSMLLSKK